MAPRILVIDDDKEIVRLVRSYLEQAGYVVLQAFDGETALHVIRAERPDLLVLDLNLPRRDGFEVTRWLRAQPSLAALPVLMLTARIEDTDKILGLELGADDYLTKPFNPREVVARVRALLRRAAGMPSGPHVLENGALRLDVDAHTACVGGRSIEITPTEFALLKTLLDNVNHVFTRAELIDKALGYSYEGMERTLDSHVKNLRKKIEPDASAPRYIETVFGVGYRMNAVEVSP